MVNGHLSGGGGVGFLVFTPPSTPPEPAPPDRDRSTNNNGNHQLPQIHQVELHRNSWQQQIHSGAASLATASSSHTSLDEAACKSADQILSFSLPLNHDPYRPNQFYKLISQHLEDDEKEPNGSYFVSSLFCFFFASSGRVFFLFSFFFLSTLHS